MTAQYKLLQPHFINNVLRDQGTIVTEGVEIPVGWRPTLLVDPLNADALTAFYAAGPRGVKWESMNLYGQENYIPPPSIKPVTFWFQSSPGFYKLTGIGALLAPVPGV